MKSHVDISDKFERPVCTLCRVDDTIDFSPGTYHLNLLPPFSVGRCRHCGMLFLSPRPGKILRQQLFAGHVPEELKDYSVKTANYSAVTANREPFFRDRVSWLLELYKSRHNSPNSNIKLLDVGASSGRLVEITRERGMLAEGLEASLEGALTAVRKNLGIPIGLAEHLPFADNIFDIVHANHVYEHLEDPLAAAQEALRVLKPGGLVFIEVPNQFDNIMFRRDMLFHRTFQRKRNVRSIHHLWFFSKPTLANVLHKAGFNEVRVQDHFRGKWIPWQAPFTLATRLVGKFLFGGEILNGWGWK